jgi:predicted hydrocarbon binding protein
MKDKISLHIDTFYQMERSLEQVFSKATTSKILEMMATKCGAESYRRIVDKTAPKEEILRQFSRSMNDKNWGKLSFLNIDVETGVGKVRIIDSFESRTRKTTQPSCHFFRGFLAGFLSELFGKTVEVAEEKCAGKEDEHCEFVFG